MEESVQLVKTYLETKSCPMNIRKISKDVKLKKKFVHLILQEPYFKRTDPLSVGSNKKTLNVFELNPLITLY
tara:strand:- start:307 stop:522 length:216 start_codon:yes stop_codon:yes gene_type:complete